MATERSYAHVLDNDGVTPVLFEREGPRWSNAEPVYLPPGAWLDFGGQITIRNGESVKITHTFFMPGP